MYKLNVSLLFLSIFMTLTLSAQDATIPQENFADPKPRTKVIKIGLLSPLLGHTSIGYEQWVHKKLSIKGTLGIIGAGFDPGDRNAAGMFIKIGPKLRLGKDFYIPGMVDAHPLHGAYFAPEVSLSVYKDDWEWFGSNPNNRETTTAVALNFNFGKQWVIDGRFSIDLSAGVGYGYSSRDDDFEFHFSHTGGASEFPISFSSSFSFGFLLK